jgi:hypothetical protein
MITLLIITGVICIVAGLLLTTLMQGQYSKWIDNVEVKEEDLK